MTLKLIDKDLRNKYAEALYKNELSYDKEIDNQMRRIKLDTVRSSHMIEANSQVFLNKIRQKRLKWSQDDLRFRDHYKLVCRNVYNKKLDNLNQCFLTMNTKQLNKFSKERYEYVKRTLEKNNQNSLSIGDHEEVEEVSEKTSIPKLPSIVFN